jgi:hypothetical protein
MDATKQVRVSFGWLLALTAILPQCRSTASQPSLVTDATTSSARDHAAAASTASHPIPGAPTSGDGGLGRSDGGGDIAERLKVAGLEVSETRQFLDNLKTRTAQRDREGVCSLVSYPMTVQSKQASRTIANEAACRGAYDSIFNSAVLSSISREHFEDLFANWRGVMIGDGAVWFGGICSDRQCQNKTIKIVSINN